jgi:hypothetical protein
VPVGVLVLVLVLVVVVVLDTAVEPITLVKALSTAPPLGALIICVSRSGSGPEPGTTTWLVVVVVVIGVSRVSDRVSEVVEQVLPMHTSCARATSGVAIRNSAATTAPMQPAAKIRPVFIKERATSNPCLPNPHGTGIAASRQVPPSIE